MTETAAAALPALFEAQRAAFRADSFPGRELRLDRLARLRALLVDHEAAIAQAISADFGHRSVHETAIAETMMVLATLSHARRHLRGWMKTRRVATTFHSLPGSSWITPQPLGVVGIVSPWNYPLQLGVGPAVAALAAGNRVLIKPSELTPRFSDLLERLVRVSFAADEMAVVPGDVELARQFVSLPFDHLFFTGSTAVGRSVAAAAAPNLTPVTLELGGKSPVIVDASANLAEAARRIAVGKLLNAGQTCIAPDYALVPEQLVPAFAQAFAQAAVQLYPTLEHNPDYSSIVNGRHYGRLRGLVDDACTQGARAVATHPGAQPEAAAGRKMHPVLLLDVTPAMAVMQEEIFGPVLPVVGYRTLDDAIAFVNQRPRPLALYWFGTDREHRDRVLHDTISGGVTLNDVLLHIAQENLPFGGVGASGSGAYHGGYGFRLFSKDKPVFEQSAFAGAALLRPPYGKRTEIVLRILKRLLS